MAQGPRGFIIVRMKLEGQVAWITGGARGIGGAVAVELASHGADIAIFDILPENAAAEVMEAVKRAGRRVVFVQGDVSQRADCERALEESTRALGPVSILVNNAAFSIRKPLLDLEVSDVERTWAVTLWGVFHCSQLAARVMAQHGRGNIVMISSVHAERAFVRSTAYNAAKVAVNKMAETWAVELAAHGIRVNIIEPGWTDTPGERSFYSEQQIKEQGGKLLMGRLARPEEIAKAVAFLASSDSSYITGATLRVDGGLVLPSA